MKILSFDSEAAWLEARRFLLTATMMARLMGSRSEWPRVQAERDGTAPAFHGNQFTEHGKAREPEIAEYLQMFVDSRLVYNAHPQRIYVADDGVSAATPDMVLEDGEDGLMVAEIKTVKSDNEWPMPTSQAEAKRLLPALYWWQVQWQMFVTGANACIFAWEPHVDFQPLDVKRFIIDRDQQAIDEMCAVRDEFLAGDWRTNVKPDVDHILQRLYEVRLMKKPLDEDEKRLLDELRECLGDEDATYEGAGFKVSYVMPKPRRTWQAEAFAEAHPELVDEFTAEVPARQRTLRISEVKPNA